MKKQNFKFRIREEALYWWNLKNQYFRVVILKHVSFNEESPSKSQYHVKFLDENDFNKDWTVTIPECNLTKIENPNNLMKDIIK